MWFYAWLCARLSGRRYPSYDECQAVKREYCQNCFVLYWRIQLHAHLRAVLTGELGFVGIGLVSFCFWFLSRSNLIVIGFVILCFCVLFGWSLVVSISAIDCPERLVPEMTFYVSNGTLNSTPSCTHCAVIDSAQLWRQFLDISYLQVVDIRGAIRWRQDKNILHKLSSRIVKLQYQAVVSIE